MLQRAAVVGREFSLGAVAALVGSEVARGLLALSRAGLVHPAAAADPGDDGYSFHHVLLRDAAYASLTKSDRADLHERAAAWIDRGGHGDDALVGYHLEQAVRYRRELGQEADELAAVAGERLGDAGMRVWRMNDVAAAASMLRRATASLLLERGARSCCGNSPSPSGCRALRTRTRLSRRLREKPPSQGAEPLAARVSVEYTYLELFAGRLTLDEAAGAFASALATLRAENDARGLARAELCMCSLHSPRAT